MRPRSPTHTLLWLTAVVAGACGEPTPSGGRADVPHDAAAAARWVECTEAARAPMEATLLARYGLTREDDRVDGLRCVTIQLGAGQLGAGATPRPAFFVELIASAGDEHRRLVGVLATDQTTELVGLRDGRLDWTQRLTGKVSFEPVDLDGDRADELLVHYKDPRHGATWVDVLAFRGRGLAEIAGPRLSYEDPDLDDERCRATLATKRVNTTTRLVVTTTASTGKSDHCLPAGTHHFALDADRLVPASPN